MKHPAKTVPLTHAQLELKALQRRLKVAASRSVINDQELNGIAHNILRRRVQQ